MENNIFEQEFVQKVINRVNQLSASTTAKWGKMDVGQMLAHLNVGYEMVYTDKHKKPNAFVGLILKTFIKNKVVGEASFPKNGKTAPAFVISTAKDFEKEKNQLIDYLNKTQQLGMAHFDGKESLSFGKLTASEWNNLFYKHINHHFNQFGV